MEYKATIKLCGSVARVERASHCLRTEWPDTESRETGNPTT